ERGARRAAVSGNRGRGRARIFVIEGTRAQRSGVVFLRGEPGVLLVSGVPRRFLLSERAGFERQVSAGAVLVRRGVEDFDIALIRTRPRAEAEPSESSESSESS